MNKRSQKQYLNIAMIGHKWIPGGNGGVEVVVEELSTRMAALGHKVTCYNRSGSHQGKKTCSGGPKEYKGVRIKQVPTLNRRGFAAMTSSIFGAIRAAFGKYDVVHFHAEGPSFMCWLPKLFGKKIVVTVHGLDHQRAKWGRFASRYIMMGEHNIVRFADEIIVLSRSAQNYFLDHYDRKTIYIPNGVILPEKKAAKEITDQFGLEKDGYILFLGRIVPEKGLAYLIEAFQNVKTDKKLVIAGGSSDTDEFFQELKEKSKKDKRISFIGFVSGRVREELYSNAYFYTLPSDLEGMPLSLLEAMSYGNCCLISSIEECVEVAEDKAAVFQKGDVSDLSNKIQKLCDEKELVEKYRKETAEFIHKKDNWDMVVRKTLALYR